MFKPNKTILKFKNVSFGYKPKQLVLSNISFSIFENEHIAIIGSNASGKSTLGKIIAGLFKPLTGSIYLKGEQVCQDNIVKLKQSTGIVFENPDSQFVGITVQDDIAFGLENQRVQRNKMQQIINASAKRTGIFNLLKSSPYDLSGGQKQLAAITSVIAMKPEIIVFDEVTNMLDNKSKQQINSLINLLKNKWHKTIISITHDMNEALKADRIIVMHKGKIVLIGNPTKVFTQKIEYFSLDKPFVFKLSQELGLKPTTNLDKLVEEIVNEK